MTKKMLVLAASALLLPFAYAVDYPEVKEGLWSVHTQSIDNPGNKKSEGTYTICRDHAFDKSVQANMKEMKGCTKVSENLSGGKYTLELRCVVSGTTIVTKGASTFQGDTAFHSENHATYTPPMYGMSETTMIMDEKYVGGCPAGTKPGDRTNSDGKVMHLGNH
ncbi:MAG: DUF3617 family protein [Terriglobales bacterium]|jgi:hypothetical protein